MRIISLILACFLLANVANAKQTVYTIKNDGGGYTAEYQAKYEHWSKQKAKVIIDGECASSCTLVVSTRYNLDVCATDNAQLLFHKPYYTDRKSKKILNTAHFRSKSETDWVELFVEVMPKSIKKVLASASIPSVYAGADKDDVQGWRAPDIFRHIKKCK